MTGYDHFRYSGHADKIATHAMEKIHSLLLFLSWSGTTGIDPFFASDALFG
jgi:hypothetical protein